MVERLYLDINWIQECIPQLREYRIAGKFGEMAKNDYKLILARFKFGDLYWRISAH